MPAAFPRTEVAGVSLPRMLMGSNWMLGYSHTSPAADARIHEAYARPEDFYPVIGAFLEHGVDALMGLIGELPLMRDALEYARQKSGRPIIAIDTPILNVEDSAEGRRQARGVIGRSAKAGAAFCLPHHTCVERLVDKGKGEIRRLGDYTSMIREAGMIPGLSAHMP